ncbi:MAG: AbrB/MazE/SpoVT family DNA-binding domain-containing protein [Candidatus Nanoarchaeia archaeon]
MPINVKTKKWGNSIGVIIPSETVEQLSIKPDEKLIIEIEKNGNVLKEMFGTMKSKKTAKQIVDEVRRDLESKWMR